MSLQNHIHACTRAPVGGATRRPAPIARPPNATHFSSLGRKLTTTTTRSLGDWASNAISNASRMLLDALVDSTFTFSHQPLRPSEGNFAPVDETSERMEIMEIEGTIPMDFPQGMYIRNGSNPLFGALHEVRSVLGQSEDIWVEGEGMLHALYFTRSSSNGGAAAWSISYANRYVQSDTFAVERARRRPCFLSITRGNPLAVIAASVLNMLRFGKVMRNMSNTSVFAHAGRVFAAAENDIPHEIDLDSLDTLGSWSVGGDWNMPFTAHPKVVPGSGELVISGINIAKPYLTVGVISEDGMELKRKVDLKLDRCTFFHEIGITNIYTYLLNLKEKIWTIETITKKGQLPRYNIVMDMPVTISPTRILRGAPLVDYEKESYARIGVMPRYGDAQSVIWFDVEPFCTLHLVNCFEEGDEVVVRGFRVPASIIMGPMLEGTPDKESGEEELNDEYFARLYEWRLNLKSRAVAGKWLTGIDVTLEFPVINDKYVGLHHRYAYAQLVDVQASLSGGCGKVRPKFGGLAKLYLEGKTKQSDGVLINVEYHHLDKNQFCSGATFVPKVHGAQEDDGWIISFVHDEGTNISQAHIIDTRRFQSGPVAKITLPHRVPYGFHGTFVPKNKCQHKQLHM